METSIISEMVSQQTICRVTESLNIEINCDKECNLTLSKEKMEPEQTKDNSKWAREVYFKYFPWQKMAQTKATVQKGATAGIKTLPQPPKHPEKKNGVKVVKSLGVPARKGIKKTQRSRHYRPGMKALWEIRQFQKSTKLLIPKMAFLRVAHEILQRESPPSRIQASAILALHETAEAYLIHLMEGTYLCAIHVKYITILPNDMQLVQRIWGETLQSSWMIFVLLLCSWKFDNFF